MSEPRFTQEDRETLTMFEDLMIALGTEDGDGCTSPHPRFEKPE